MLHKLFTLLQSLLLVQFFALLHPLVIVFQQLPLLRFFTMKPQLPPSSLPPNRKPVKPNPLNPHRHGRPIFSTANFCEHLFDAIRRLHPEPKDRCRFERAHIRFRQWAKSLHVRRGPGQNLDSLLDPSREPLRLQITEHLDNFRSCLLDALKSAQDLPAIPNGNFDGYFPDIESSLTKLENFTPQILHHTPAGLGARVAEYRALSDNTGFDRAVVDLIRTKFPHLKPTIVAKEPWWRHLGLDLTVSSEAVEEPAWDAEPTGMFKALADAVLFTHYKSLYDWKFGEQERKDAQDPGIASMRLPVEQDSAPTDSVPDQTDRPICDETSPSPTSGNPNLDEEKPYVCLAANCDRSNPPLFKNPQEWKTHMRKCHRLGGIVHLQRNVQWRCPDCKCLSPVEFGSIEVMARDLIRHQCTHHGKQETQDSFSEAKLCYISCRRPSDICPICGKNYPDGSEQPASSPDKRSKAEMAEDYGNSQVDDCAASHMLDLFDEVMNLRLHSSTAAAPATSATSQRSPGSFSSERVSSNETSSGDGI